MHQLNQSELIISDKIRNMFFDGIVWKDVFDRNSTPPLDEVQAKNYQNTDGTDFIKMYKIGGKGFMGGIFNFKMDPMFDSNF